MQYISILIILFFYSFSLATELKSVSSEDFIKENYSQERVDIIQFITEQFNNYQDLSITQDYLNASWAVQKQQKDFNIARFQIINQYVYADSNNLKDGRFNSILEYLKKITKIYKINNVDFIIYTDDTLEIAGKTKNSLINTPAFIMSKDTNSIYETDLFLFPDLYLLDNNWKDYFTRIESANKLIKWDSKINKVFWRGNTTGGIYNLENFDKLPRVSLVMLSRLYPDLIDASFVRYLQFSNDKSGNDLEELFKILSSNSSFNSDKNYVSEENHLFYKYLISIDGNSCAWKRVPWIMLSNSVLLKQESNKVEWFYSALKSNYNYISVNNNLSNIFEKIEWMNNHDDDIKKISENAQYLVKNNLMPKHIEAHAVLILNEYSKLHKENKISPSLYSTEEIKNKLNELSILEYKNRKKRVKRFFRNLFN